MERRKFIRKATNSALLASIVPVNSLYGNVFSAPAGSRHICIFSKHLEWLPYKEMAKLASEIGFTGIDLTVRKNGHVLPENVRMDLPRAVELIRAEGLEVPMITTEITDPDDPLTHDILKTAGELGIKLYRTGWFPYVKGIKVTEQLDVASKKLLKLQDINAANNIAASYQNHAGNSIGSSGWDLLPLMRGLDPAWTGIQFDIRHAMVEGFESWQVLLEILAPFINSIDLKDFSWGDSHGPRVVNVPLGKGLVKFDAFLEKVEEFQITADFSIHYEYPLGGAEHGDSELSISKGEFVEQVAADLNYLKQILL